MEWIDNENKCAKENCSRPAYKSKYGESPYCARHGGNSIDINGRAKEKRNYYRTKWASRIGEKANSPNVKSLKEELGILRVVMEEKLSQCADTYELNLESPAIASLALQIERIVSSIHNIDLKMAITQENVTAIIDVIAVVLTDNIKDKDVLEKINADISKGISSLETI